jgi:hypothetical protein
MPALPAVMADASLLLGAKAEALAEALMTTLRDTAGLRNNLADESPLTLRKLRILARQDRRGAITARNYSANVREFIPTIQ